MLSGNTESYWNSFGELSQNLSENFKDICNHMISPEPKERKLLMKY